MRPLIIFTDLDGTLLDHDSYSWEPAAAAIERIANNEIPLIVNTSKTMTEVHDIRRALNNHHPFIIENGGAVCVPMEYFKGLAGNDDFHLKLFGKAYPEILKILTSIRDQYHFSFKGFADISAEELADLTGLALEHAVQAKQRDCSEPVIWTDSEKSFQKFCTLLQEHHLQVISGGRFFHVMGQTDKGSAMGWLLNQYRSAYPNHKFTSIALGDSPNDLPMLEQADYSVVIKSSSGKSLMLNKMENAIYTRECGPVGWQIAIEKLLEQLGD